MKQPMSEKIIGYLLLTPAIIAVVAFVFSEFLDIGNSSIINNITYEGHSGLALFIGLLALAGVYILKSGMFYTDRHSVRRFVDFLSQGEPQSINQTTSKELISESSEASKEEKGSKS